MNNKIISVLKQPRVSKVVGWNHEAFHINKIDKLIRVSHIIGDTTEKDYKYYLKYFRLIKQFAADDAFIFRKFNNFLPTLNQFELLQTLSVEEGHHRTFLRHFAIIMLDELIQQANRSPRDLDKEVIELLGKLVEQSNNSTGECFQVSVHYACKFFAEFYPARREEINKIILLEDHQRELRGED
jgi:hypothetical protein